MNVLSLFDGMSCGQIALNNLNFKIDNYFASEIDKHSIKVTQHNYPNTIQLGDIRNLSYYDNKLYKNSELIFDGEIHLVMGGSPCQGFSFAGKQLNFNDPRSSLFFEFVRLLNEIKPKYFLLENVNMLQSFQDIISNYLKVKPILINSRLVSAQDRKRLYWTNIPNIEQPEDLNVSFKDICIDNGFCASMRGRRINQFGKRDDYSSIPIKQYVECRMDNKTNCLTTVSKDNVVVYDKIERTPIENIKYRYLTPIEYERLQTVPDDYTSVVSDSQRRKMLGNGWTIKIIEHILKNIKK